MKNKLTTLLLILFILQIFITGSFGQSEQKAELVVQTGHTSSIISVVFSPDGKLLASAGVDKTIKIWDVATGQELKTLPAETSFQDSIVFSPDGKFLASGGKDKIIKFWDIVSGQVIKTFEGHTGGINSLVFSPDGKNLFSSSSDKTIKLWEVSSGRELRTFPGHNFKNSQWDVITLAISPNGKTLASGSFVGSIRLWDVASGRELMKLPNDETLAFSITKPLAFSPDGRILASVNREDNIQLWDTASGQIIENLAGHKNSIHSLKFSSDGKTLVSAGKDKIIKLWDVASRRELRSYAGHTDTIQSVVFSPDGKTLASAGDDRIIKLWDFASGRELKTFSKHSDRILSVRFSPDGKTVAAGGIDKNIRLWDIATGQKLRILYGHKDLVSSVTFSPDGHTLISTSEDTTIKVWDVATGEEIKTLVKNNVEGEVKSASSITFSPDGKIFVSEGYYDSIRIWDSASGNELKVLKHKGVASVNFSPDGSLLISTGSDETVRIWDVASGQQLKAMTGHTNWIPFGVFSPDGKLAATGSPDRTVRIWDVASGQELKNFPEGVSSENSLAFSPNGKILAAENYAGKLNLWNVESGELIKTYESDNPAKTREVLKVVPDFYLKNDNEPVNFEKDFQIKRGSNGRLDLYNLKKNKLEASLITLDEKDWAAITPNGLFDASPNGRKLMHYIIGLEPVSLEQMKDLYYIPGLLQKVFKEEPLPNVELFSKKDLFPEVEFSATKDKQKDLTIKIKNRGGGIGQIQILINGKEFIADARPARFDSNVPESTLTVSLNDAPFFAGQENKIEVVARNAAGSLSNRGTPRGSDLILLGGDKMQTPTPNIYAIVGGISDYTGDNLDLSFSAKDAEDFAKALEIGASKLLGDTSKVHIRLLTSNGDKSNAKFTVADAKISTATKNDFQKAFADFSNAQPNDVFIVYMAGHGVSLNLNQNPNQAGGDTYLYLTQEATTTDKSVLSVKQSREAMSVSSEEIKNLMKHNKALKQVLILDTCAAGALSNSLVGKRDLPSDQIRAIERLKDNTGFYVLMGSAANAVSYEASQYGQGLLTYSLLQGMKGAKLRENQFADVSLLFGYAQETVPQMAKNIGGIQRPLIITPDTSASFDIGKFTDEEQAKINLAKTKPIILRPSLQNKEQDYDDLELTKALQTKLREANFIQVRGGDAPLVFVDADEMFDAVKPSGSYIVKGDEITVTIRLIRNKEPINTLTVKSKLSEREELLKMLVEKITEASKP